MIGMPNSLIYDLCNGDRVCTTLTCTAETLQDLRSIQTILLSQENIARYEAQFGKLVVIERQQFNLPEAEKGFWAEFFNAVPNNKYSLLGSFDGITTGLLTTRVLEDNNS
jgi:hypothetical protein